MAFDAHANLAGTTIATAPSPPTSGTSLVVSAGGGARFPAPPFNATVWPAATAATPANAEILRVTARTTDTLTILRAQEGTPARAIGSGDQIAATITAKTLTDVETEFATVARLTAVNTFTTNQIIQAADPAVIWIDTGQPANSRLLYWVNTAQQMSLLATDDFYGVQTRPVIATRPGDVKVWRDVYEKQRTTPLGHWIDVPYSAGNFAAPGATWTVASGSVLSFAYTLIGKTMIVTMQLNNTSLSAAVADLLVTLPLGASAKHHGTTGLLLENGGTWGVAAQAYVVANDPKIHVARSNLTAFAAGTISFYLTLPISLV